MKKISGIKKFAMLCLLSLLAAGLCLAQDNEEVIEFDLGTVNTGDVARGRVSLGPEVETVVSLCECVSFVLDRSPQGSILELSFDSSGYQGETLQELIVIEEGRKIRIKLHVQVE